MVYSPLEQFEPVSFCSILLNYINLSITNISFMFIFIILVFIFFLNGYFFVFNNNSVRSHLQADINNIEVTSNNTLTVVSKLYSYINVFGVVNNLKNKALNTDFQVGYRKLWMKLFFNILLTKNTNTKLNLGSIQNGFKRFSIIIGITEKSTNSRFTAYKVAKSFKSNSFSRLFIPTTFIYLFESVYDFILTQVKAGIEGDNKVSVKFFPVIFFLFNFLLIANILGLIPYSSTVTAYIIITLTLAMTVLIGVTIYAFQNHGRHFFSFFLPSGVPLALWPLLITIELISYVMRVVSLSVRLFANMMAGHTLLAVLAGFGWTMATSGVFLFLVHPLPILVVFVLVGLELAVACIQAFVFALLSCIYISDAINLH